MATLKEHQAAMVDLLANGSAIPASAMRLAHAMHDVLNVLNQTANGGAKDVDIDYAINALRDATTPGLNDKALSKPQEALKTDSPAKWPTPAEQRVKELENTIRQLKANVTMLRGEKAELSEQLRFEKEWYAKSEANVTRLKAEIESLKVTPEQAGCRKEDTQGLQISRAEDIRAKTRAAVWGTDDTI